MGQIVAIRPRCKVYIAGLRLHHAMTGFAVAAAGVATRSRPLFIVGCALVAHDWRDHPWPLIDR